MPGLIADSHLVALLEHARISAYYVTTITRDDLQSITRELLACRGYPICWECGGEIEGRIENPDGNRPYHYACYASKFRP